mmetsp:Transcript_8919/g.20976  ORF Transcript_8919/g.20976 Transcript_8919/m.20976 type:complete len:109 (+) Transcript_8919:301-627(+)
MRPGSPVIIVEFSGDWPGDCRETRLGSVASGLVPAHTVPAGTWFGAYPEDGFSFVGCTLGPAFEMEDFELGDRDELLEQFPRAEEQIARLVQVYKEEDTKAGHTVEEA